VIILVNDKVSLQNGFDVSALAGSFSTKAKDRAKKKALHQCRLSMGGWF